MKVTRRDVRRALIPLGLLGIGVALLIGCIPIPGSYQPRDGGFRPEAHIGGPTSGEPIRLRRSTRDEVIRVIGTPHKATPDGRTFVYDYQVNTVTTVFPLCFMALPEYAWRYLRLDFNEAGELQRYKVYKSLTAADKDFRQRLVHYTDIARDPTPVPPAPSTAPERPDRPHNPVP